MRTHQLNDGATLRTVLHFSLDELQEALLLTPEDTELRRRLVEALLDVDDVSSATEHFSVIAETCIDQPWALTLGIRLALTTGDHLQAARYKKQLKAFLESEDFDEEDFFPESHPSHPSHERTYPALRLVVGGVEADGHLTRRQPLRRLDDIVGLATVKRNLIEIIENTQSEASTNSWLGGTLFYGPPSCGKAFCAEVVAGEIEGMFWRLDLSDSWGTAPLCQQVQDAIEESATTGVVLYLENLDAWAPENIHAIKPMIEMLNSARGNSNFVVLGSATYPWLASNDIVKPGLLGRVLLLLPPDAPARRIFISERLGGQALMDEENIEWIVSHTEGHSFGDLDRLIDVAAAVALTSTKEQITKEQITTVHINRDAVRTARRQVLSSSADWLTTAGHHALMNEAGGLYDDLLQYFRTRQRH